MSRRTDTSTTDPRRRPRNPIGFREHLARAEGSPLEFDLRRYDGPLAEIERLEADLASRPRADLEARAREVRARVDGGAALAEVRPTVYALVRDASRRALGLRPFDVQVVAALALDEGKVVEMQTGEGKTLAAVMPACLNALTGRGVHVLTFNDYLARRDAEWMGPIYAMLGLSVECVQQGMTPAERRHAYAADVTYVTAKEAGFDHLRDQIATEVAGLVHRPFHFALVDEADSLLIDEARSPLVIAGSVVRETSSAERLAALVATFEPGVHFDADEYGRDVELTDRGVDAAEQALEIDSLHEERNLELLTGLNCALHANVLLRRDVDYIVRDGRIQVVDEFTGRVVPDRHWPDGLQAALEAKEGLARRSDGSILGSMTLQHFLLRYPRLCGMTGTARDAAVEIDELYGLRTVVVPTNRPMIRIDRPDVVFRDRPAKQEALVGEIQRVHAVGRPVLVGTLTVEESEGLAQALRAAGVSCEVLNAKNDTAEAPIVARAGCLGAVTISTNMAGRGTDIRLGGEDEADHARVASLGGLYVIGTNRHESRRVDLQLRGRAGRQGDPGESRFFVSLEDELLVRYGIGELIPARLQSLAGLRARPANTAGEREASDANHGPSSGGHGFSQAGAIDHPVIRREVARAQRIVEGQNLEIRRTLWRYASLVEEQRRRVMERRQALLTGREMPRGWAAAPGQRSRLVAAAGEEAVVQAERAVTLFHIDRAWRDHLALIADLREGIHLVALGGRDPLTHFSTQVVQAFDAMPEAIEARVLEEIGRVDVRDGRLSLDAIGIKGPSSTWTYIVNDDPFRNQIGMMLTGPGRTTIAIYAAVVVAPLLILWGLVDTFLRRRPKRRRDPFGN